jgi:hypothetical protein
MGGVCDALESNPLISKIAMQQRGRKTTRRAGILRRRGSGLAAGTIHQYKLYGYYNKSSSNSSSLTQKKCLHLTAFVV